MSCDGNRGVYFVHICATAGAGSGVTPADLETLYERNIGNPSGFAEELLNDAKTRKLFAEMRRLTIAPPTHSPTGLPKKPSRRGYAAIHDEFKRRGWLRDSDGEPAEAPASPAPLSVGVTGDAVAEPGRAPVRAGMLADAGAAAPASAPPAARIVAVQGKPGKIDTVVFRVNGGPPRYVWGGSWQEMKDCVKAIPGGAKRPWFRGGNVNVWELSCTDEDADTALAAKGWQIAASKPDQSSVIRAGAAIIDASGTEILAASPPAPPLVPVHRADGSIAWVPEGSPAAPNAPAASPPEPAAPKAAEATPAPVAKPPTKAAQEEQIAAQARELLKAAPRLIEGANGEATLEGGTQVAAQLQRWAEAARPVVKREVRDLISSGDSYIGSSALVGLRYYAQAACVAVEMRRCKCGQFQALDGSHVCPSDRYDAAGYNPAGYNRRGFDKEGFTAQGRDAEGYDRGGYRPQQTKGGVGTENLNRRGYNGYGAHQNGTHASGYFIGFKDGYDFYGYSSDGYDRDGYDRDGYHRFTGHDRSGFNRSGLDAAGNHIAGNPDADGLYADGYDQDGYDRDGFAPDGLDAWGFTRDGFTSVSSNGVRRDLSKDGRDGQGMRYLFNGCDIAGVLPNGRALWGTDRNGELRKMRSPITRKLIRATYDADGVDAGGINRHGFSVRDGLSEPDEEGRRVAANGWVYDPAKGDLFDPQDLHRRMSHQWKTTKVRIGRVAVMMVFSTGTPPPFTPPIDGRAPPSESLCRALGKPPTAWRSPDYALSSPRRLDVLRGSRDPAASRNGMRLKCPYCKQFTGGVAHKCPHFKAKADADPQNLGQTVMVSTSGIVVDATRGQARELMGQTYSNWAAAQSIVYNPAVPDYDMIYRAAGYDTLGRDPDGFDAFGYNQRGMNRKGYTREGYDVLGFDADGYDRNGYNRQGKDRSGKERPLTVDELRRSLAPGDEPLATDAMARHYSRLAQAITNKPVTVKFDTSVPTGATDMRGNIYLNPHPLGKDAAPARNMLVVKAIMYHEVGHELTTNGDHWAELKGIAASPVPVEGIDKGRGHVLRFYNIVEDGRMERDMSDRFPGVAGALAAAARLRDKWDFAVGEGIPPLYQVTGALLYTTLPYYRVPQEVVDKMTPDARALYEELRPIALQGALGTQEDAREATKEIVRRLERAGAFDAEAPEQQNIEITPPGGPVGNKPPKPPKPPMSSTPPEAKTPSPASDEGGAGGDGEGEGEDKDAPNGRGKGWRKGQKTAPDKEPSERQHAGDEDDSGAGGSQVGEDDEGEAGGAGGSQVGEDDQGEAGGSQGGSSGGSQGSEDDEAEGNGAGGSQGGSSGGSQGGEDDEAEEDGSQGDSSSGSRGGDEGEAGGAGGAQGDSSGGSQGGEDDEAEAGGASGSQGGEDDEGESGGAGGAQGGSQSGQQSRSQGSQSGNDGEDSEDGEGDNDGEEGADGSQSGRQGRSQDGEDGEDGDGEGRDGNERGNARPQRDQNREQPANSDAMLEPEMGEGDDNLGGDGSGGERSDQPVAVSGERFDPITPFTDAELDAALKAADREAAQVIAAQVRGQANYNVLGKRLHRRLNADRTASQAYRTADGRAIYVDVAQPRTENAAHIRTLDGHERLHREVSGKLARQLETIRAQADKRMRFQTSGKLDQRRIVAAVRGADEVRVKVQEQPATSMAISLTLDFSGSMNRHVTAGKVYSAASILGSTFEQLDMPYEVRGHADHAAIFKAMDDEKRDPARMAMTAVVDNGCGQGNGDTASTMGLATSSLMARDERNKLIVSLMDGDMYDHDETVAQLAETRKQGVVTFGVFLGQPSAAQQEKLAQMFGQGSWVQINDLGEMPQAIGRRLARIFESLGTKK